MKLIEGNRSSMDESSLVGMRLHLEEQRLGRAAEVAGWSSGRRSAGSSTACVAGAEKRSMQLNYENELLSANFAGQTETHSVCLKQYSLK